MQDGTPVTVLVYHNVIQWIDQDPLLCRMKENDTVADLAVKVVDSLGLKLSVPATNIILWLPKDVLDTGTLQSSMRAHKHDLGSFCTNLSLYHLAEPILPHVRPTEAERSLGASTKALVAEIQHRPAVVVAGQNARAGDEESGDGDEEGNMAALKKEYQRAILAGRYAGTPSSNTESAAAYAERQKTVPIYDGYHVEGYAPTMALPVELYHPIFAKFLADVNKTDLQPPVDILRGTVELKNILSPYPYPLTEAEAEPHLRRILGTILGRRVLKLVNHRGITTDLSLVSNRTSSPVEVAVVSLVDHNCQNFGGFMMDPFIKGPLSYESMWCDPDHNGIRELCCCPSFVLGITGCSFVVSGCVLTSGVIAQRLTNLFYLDNDRPGNAAVLHAAHIFHSLRLALDDLDRYYRDLTPPSEPNEDRFFPSINTYVSGGGRLVKFRYMEPLRKGMACVTFRAVVVSTDKGHAAAAGQGKAGEEELPEVEEGQEIVVKFAEQYGDDAHRLLARQRLAPELYYCGPISSDPSLHYGARCMVVMEHIKGRTVAELVEQGKLSKILRARISEAVELLHENQMVHGDIRGQKMMVRIEGEEEKVKIINFHWAGRENEVRYSLFLSKDIKWVDGMKAFALILREHDREMLKRLVDGLDGADDNTL